MKPYYSESGRTVYCGDCLRVMRHLPDSSIDTVLTDPPYHLTAEKRGGTGVASLNPNSPAARSRIGTGFMGKAWDGGDVAFRVETWAEVLRVAKPGAFLLAFGGTRTFHRLTCAIEDAGWEIRDCIMWVYGAGFPKSLDISKAIDKAAGVERQLTRAGTVTRNGYGDDWDTGSSESRPRYDEPASDAAKLWNGWGTALKPAWEPIIVAMKPLDGTFAQNSQRHGVAGLNIDGGRISADSGRPCRVKIGGKSNGIYGDGLNNSRAVEDTTLGRFPANVILQHHPDCECVGTKTVKGDPRKDTNGRRAGGFADVGSANGDGQPNARVYGNETVDVYDCHAECPVRLLDEQSGDLAAGTKREGVGYRGGLGCEVRNDTHGDSGGASRFFYTAKASRSDRGAGNNHPTVKPTDLLKYLCKLTATPTGGTILDPFAGSGTTLVAAQEYGRPAIGIELEESHCRIIVDRLRQGVLFGVTP